MDAGFVGLGTMGRAMATNLLKAGHQVRVWRTRSTGDISLKMFLVLVTGLALWLTFGVLKGEWPIMLANGITLMLASTILLFKLKHG
jgi:MtN3 and saliva related transmembrane protein